jgi:FeS assembly SUF system protein
MKNARPIAPLADEKADALYDKVVERLRTVFDPEIPTNIYDLGLIYKIDLTPVVGGVADGKYDLHIDMTLTTPNCPVAGQMPAMAQLAVAGIEGLNEAKVDLTFNPPWDKSRMSDEARLQLNMF